MFDIAVINNNSLADEIFLLRCIDDRGRSLHPPEGGYRLGPRSDVRRTPVGRSVGGLPGSFSPSDYVTLRQGIWRGLCPALMLMAGWHWRAEAGRRGETLLALITSDPTEFCGGF